MTRLSLSVVVLLLIAADLTPRTAAEIKSLTISDDSRPTILLGKFGFTQTGHVSVSVSAVSVISPSPTSIPDPSRLGFVLMARESLDQIDLEFWKNPNFCVFDSSHVLHLFTFLDLSPPPGSKFEHSYPVSSPDEYYLFFVNCVPDTKVTVKVRTEMYNVDANGYKEYLHPGFTKLPELYFFFFLGYLPFIGLWGYACWVSKRVVHRIHILMAALLLMKALNLICAAVNKHYVKVTGTPHGWNVLFYIFQFIRALLIITVIVLIGAGWSFVKPFLQKREKCFLMVLVSLQVLANVGYIVIGETGHSRKDWLTWSLISLLVDIACGIGATFPIGWSLDWLTETSKDEGKAARNLARLSLFEQFYIVLMVHMTFIKLVVFFMKGFMAYKNRWVGYATEEVASLAFYVYMFYMFRPVKKNDMKKNKSSP